MEVKHEKRSGKGIFYIEENGERIANLLYIFKNDTTFSIEHTLVNHGYEGKGLAKALLNAAIAFARENAYKIIPVCPYAKKVMEGVETYADVLYTVENS